MRWATVAMFAIGLKRKTKKEGGRGYERSINVVKM